MGIFKDLGIEESQRLRESKTTPIPTLKNFLISAWQNVLHPGEEIDTDGAWYIDIICEELTLLTVGTLLRLNATEIADKVLEPFGLTSAKLDPKLIETRNLLINIPPRCSKTTIVSICWPCWEWLWMPWMPNMCISYAQSLASEHNDDRRAIVKSSWYKGFKQDITVQKALNRITEFANTDRGKMVGRGLNAGVTGGGGVRLIFDDPNDPNKVESEPVRTKTAKSFKDYSSTRLNNPKLSCIVTVQQRTHQKDVSGVILEDPRGYRVIIIQMEAEEPTTLRFPLTGRVLHRRIGDLMHESRFPRDIVEKLKATGDLWAGRYQQRPNAAEGTYYRYAAWRLYAVLPPVTRSIISVDCTFDDTPKADEVSIGVISQCKDVRETVDVEGKPVFQHEYYIRYVNRKRRNLQGTLNALGEVISDYPGATTRLIEKKANGPAIISTLRKSVSGIIAFNPGRTSKGERAEIVSVIQHRGDILLPIAPEYRQALIEMGLNTISVADWWKIHPPADRGSAASMPITEEFKTFVDDLGTFPNGAFDDHVDMLNQCILWAEDTNSGSGWSAFGVATV